METILSTFAITISLLTLAYVVWSGQKHSKQLSDQIKSLSEQTDLLRKQLFGEVYEEAQIRSLQFFLPAKANRPIAVFEEIQKEDEEIVLGQEIKINRRWETELHVQCWMDAPQRLRLISWGFPANVEENEYGRDDGVDERGWFRIR